jgi:hypothetical protein
MFFIFRDCVAMDCNAVPISLSDLNNCENNVCSFTQTANVAIPISQGSSACLQFFSPDGLTPDTILNITVDHANYIYRFDYNYYTDDPATDVEGFCGCPGGTTTNCDMSQGGVAYRDIVFCKTSVHKSDSCPLTAIFGTPGTWMARLGFGIRKRYKVLKMNGNYNYNIGVVFGSKELEWALEYSGSVIGTSDNPNFNVTVISDTTKSLFKSDFIVFDISNPTDYWFFDSDQVNSLTAFDIGKIGWIRAGFPGGTPVNKMINPNIMDFIGIGLSDCNRNTFYYNANWLIMGTFLNNAKNRLSHNTLPGSYIIDSDWDPHQPLEKSDPTRDIQPYYYMQDGWIFLDAFDQIKFFGLNVDDYLVPPPKYGYSSSISISGNAMWTTDSVRLNLDTATDPNHNKLQLSDTLWSEEVSVDDVETNINYDFVTWKINPSRLGLLNGTLYGGYCFKTGSSYTYICGTNPDGTKAKIEWYAYSWPSMRKSLMSYDWNGDLMETEKPLKEVPESKLIVPINNGVLNVQVRFVNFSIHFTNTVIRPKMNSLTFDDGIFTLVALSQTVSGDCMIASNPAGVITAQKISLTVSPIEYKFHIAVETFNGDVFLQLQCYQFQNSLKVMVKYNNTYNESLGGSWLDQISGRNINWGSDTTENFLSIFIIIGAVLGVLVLIFVIIKIFRWKNSKSNKKGMTKLGTPVKLNFKTL